MGNEGELFYPFAWLKEMGTDFECVAVFFVSNVPDGKKARGNLNGSLARNRREWNMWLVSVSSLLYH